MLYFSLVYFAEMGRGLRLGCATVGGFASVLHFLGGFFGGEWGGCVFFNDVFAWYFFLLFFFFLLLLQSVRGAGYFRCIFSFAAK